MFTEFAWDGFRSECQSWVTLTQPFGLQCPLFCNAPPPAPQEAGRWRQPSICLYTAEGRPSGEVHLEGQNDIGINRVEKKGGTIFVRTSGLQGRKPNSDELKYKRKSAWRNPRKLQEAKGLQPNYMYFLNSLSSLNLCSSLLAASAESSCLGAER